MECFIEQTGMLYTEEDKKMLPCGSMNVTLPNSRFNSSTWTPFLNLERLKIKGLRCMFCMHFQCSTISPLFPQLSFFPQLFHPKWRCINLIHMTQLFSKRFSKRLLERSRDYLLMYVHAFLSPTIFTFLLCNFSTV